MSEANETAMRSAIETIDLTRRFGRNEAVKHLNLRVAPGSLFALIGPNGAGKTTTLKLLMNLVRPTSGKAVVLGSEARHLGPPQWQRIGYVSENQKLPEWMTPDRLFDYCRPFYPAWDDGLRRQLQQQLELTSNTPLKTLSRGTRMKAALLSSLAYRPDLVVLDEPFTGLDPVVRDELVRSLLEVSSERSMTVLISSHDIEEVERLADWVGFMNDGRLIFAEPIPSLLDRFRVIEVTGTADTAPPLPENRNWVLHGTNGRMLRFVDTSHNRSSAASDLAAAFPSCDIRTSSMPLRDIFLILARTSKGAASMERQ
jgi:ABC-2 type transport system ATP-binding protein